MSIENQNLEYEGATFEAGKQTFRSRLAKLTPKKKGYFVVFWEKDIHNKNQAYSYKNCPDKVIVSVIDQKRKGQFIFPKEILLKQEVLSNADKKGKMAIRVYPDWEIELNPAAKRTQRWQQKYFIDLTASVDVKVLTELYL
ncbi:MepB protein [Paenibacillus sp. CAA11]|nr:MepB protein [Paenibacillus sp. CAA11]